MLSLGLGLILGSSTSLAQWVQQSVTLKPGWNAVFLQVTPAQPYADDLFASLPQVQSVWKFNRRASSLEFIESPGVLLQKTEHWLVWLPPSDPTSFLRTLQRLNGGQAYLIKVRDQAAPFVWSVKGVPSWKNQELLANSLNLIGLPVRSTSPPTFLEFFSDTPEVAASPGSSSGIFSIGPDGKEEQIRQTARAVIQPGAAYWVRCGALVRQLVPLELTGDTTAAGLLDFGTDQRQLSLVFRNLSDTQSLSLRLAPLASEAAPAGFPEVAGEVPLAYFESNLANNRFEWVPLTGPWQITLAPQEEREVRLTVRRSALKDYQAQGAAGAAYQTLLEVVENSHGWRAWVPVVAESAKVSRKLQSTAKPSSTGSELPAYSPHQGLWVGQVQIERVGRSTVAAVAAPEDPPKEAPDLPAPPPLDPFATQPVASPLSYRLLVHVDEQNRARLLQRVLLATDPANTNGQVQLYQSESRVPAGATVVSRISSVAFPVMDPVPLDPVPLTGRGFAQGMKAQVQLDYDDPVNPFKHAYHPDHNNLDENYTTNRLAAGRESFTVNREVSFDFEVTRETETGRFLPTGPVLDFSGTNQYVALDTLALGGDFALEAWVRLTGPVTNDLPVFDLGNGPAADNIVLRLDKASGQMIFSVFHDGSESKLTSVHPFPTNQWVHVAAVNDGNGTAQLYWNGTLEVQGKMDAPAAVARTSNWCGRSNADTPEYFRGRIYDLVIWDSARTAAGVYEDMYLFGGQIPGDLVAYWPANEGKGTSLSDVGGQSHSATVQGANWDTSELPSIPFWGIGRAEGVYREVIQGLRPQPIVLEGPFKLERINRDPVLH